MNIPLKKPNRPAPVKIMLVAAVVLLAAGWLILTPPGLLGKSDAIGYAVCHRISLRSFHLGERALPLCVRCTGMYLGALSGLLYQLRGGRRGGMPARKFWILIAISLAAFGVDGANSYLHFFPQAPALYEPNHYLRLITGTYLGLGISISILPVFNQTFWKDWQNEPLLASWQQMLELLVLEALLIGVTLTENPLWLYPLAVLTSLTILFILSMVYSIVLMMIFKAENSFESLRAGWHYLLGGVLVALTQIAVMDAGRYFLTHTWGGFPL